MLGAVKRRAPEVVPSTCCSGLCSSNLRRVGHERRACFRDEGAPLLLGGNVPRAVREVGALPPGVPLLVSASRWFRAARWACAATWMGLV